MAPNEQFVTLALNWATFSVVILGLALLAAALMTRAAGQIAGQ
jgi:hypothetical protein